MLKNYELKMPHTVYSGEDALGRIPRILQENAVRHLAVFTDKGIEGAGLLEFPMARVRETGVAVTVLDELPAEPSYEQAQKLVNQCKESGADFIMAVGGGSVMDTAKLASILMTDEYGIKELLDEPGRARKCMKTLMIPTTAGTGAEATPNAIVVVTVVAPSWPLAHRSARSRRDALAIARPFFPKYSISSSVSPALSRPPITAIVAGTAPHSRTAASTRSAVSTFWG